MLALSTVAIYLLAEHEPKYFELIIAAIAATHVYAVTTLYAVIKGVTAQEISIPLSIFVFSYGYFFAKVKLVQMKKARRNKTHENSNDPNRSPSTLRRKRHTPPTTLQA